MFEMPILGVNRGDLTEFPFRAVFIPFSCEIQALKNHQQTFSKLKSRGGLCPVEIYLILEGIDFRFENWKKISLEMCKERFKECGIVR